MYPFDTLPDNDVDAAPPTRLRKMGIVLTVLVGLLGLRYLLAGEPVPDLGLVTGVVTMNGQPAGDVMVEFHPDPYQGTKGYSASSVTDADGRYRARINRYEKDGAVIGRHRVVVWSDPSPAVAGAKTVRVPSEYTDVFTTPLQPVEVKPGEQVYDIVLSTKTK